MSHKGVWPGSGELMIELPLYLVDLSVTRYFCLHVQCDTCYLDHIHYSELDDSQVKKRVRRVVNE